jgi:hypothetical protein
MAVQIDRARFSMRLVSAWHSRETAPPSVLEMHTHSIMHVFVCTFVAYGLHTMRGTGS